MRILIANNRYFQSGGPERYLFSISSALSMRGHAVIPFALAYRDNAATVSSGYFPPTPLNADFVRIDDRPLGAAERVRLAAKIIWNSDVYRHARRILREKRIDVAYALQVAHYLFPEIMLAARDERVPIVWRQSDFQILCPAYNSFRAGKPCLLCDKALWPALRHRCLKGSISMTAVRVLAMHHARLRGADRIPARIVCPTSFLIERLRKTGFPHDKLVRLPTPTTEEFFQLYQESTADPHQTPSTHDSTDRPYALYVGGFFAPKGPAVAVEAARGRAWRLVLAGDTDTPEGARLRAAAAGAPNIEFVGRADAGELGCLYRDARAVIIPSLWYENLPNVLVEAMAAGKAVVGSDVPGISEFIDRDDNGLLFPAGDSERLAALIDKLMADPKEAARLGANARASAMKNHRMDDHVLRLESLFEDVIRSRRGPGPALRTSSR